MPGTISILMALAFAAIYPLCFWISADDPIKNNFHKLHIGLPNAVGGAVLIAIWLMDVPFPLKMIVTVWKAVLLSVSGYSWKKTYPGPGLMLLPCLLGVYAFIRVQAYLVGPGWAVAFIGVLNGLIFCSAFFTANLGRWYLTTHGLPIIHLTRATYVFLFLLGVRALWDAYFLFTGEILYGGDEIALTRFIVRQDGFPLMIGLFLGTLFPLISVLFVKKILKSKDIQPAIGILCLVLCSILAGDLAYKYYLITFGIVF